MVKFNSHKGGKICNDKILGNVEEALLFRFSTAKELLFLAFILSSFFLLDFDTLVLEPIE